MHPGNSGSNCHPNLVSCHKWQRTRNNLHTLLATKIDEFREFVITKEKAIAYVNASQNVRNVVNQPIFLSRTGKTTDCEMTSCPIPLRAKARVTLWAYKISKLRASEAHCEEYVSPKPMDRSPQCTGGNAQLQQGTL